MVEIKFRIGGSWYEDRYDDGEDERIMICESAVASTVREVADKISVGIFEGKIRDGYGNTVGEFKVE